MGEIKNLAGKRFNMLTAVEYVGKRGKWNRDYWLCVCDCGNKKVVESRNLMHGAVKSCGCLHKKICGPRMSARNRTHGKSDTRLYRIYRNMIQRCKNKNHAFYPRYGGRGIAICDEWKDFLAFESWALANGYADGLTIDRIDNDGAYEPSNCRWVPIGEQQRNRSSNHYVTIDGETHCLAEWAEINGLSYATVEGRLHHGWDDVSAVTTQPLIKRERKRA